MSARHQPADQDKSCTASQPQNSTGSGESLTILANRLPVTSTGDGKWEVSPGGLVSALAPVVKAGGGNWIGWSGAIANEGGPLEVNGLSLIDISIDEEEYENYYCGMANEILWPLFHDGVRHPHYSEPAWQGYKRVNRRFANAAADIAPKNGLVWIHDYHLLLVPGLLRELRPDIRIGLFLHIPVPPVELFATLPWRDELVSSLAAADLVGTQTEADALNLRKLLVHPDFAEAEVTDDGDQQLPSLVAVEAFPISIDTQRYLSAARESEADGSAQKLREQFGTHRTLFLGVDRLDYTKGIDRRLEAFELALKSGKIEPNDVRFVQIAVPSRLSVQQYQEISDRVDSLVGSINGQFSGIGDAIVHYSKQGLSFEELIPLYRAADVMVVTPFRDGMNLVAKEFVATRFDATGQIILSEFSGASKELTDAMIVNPHDVHSLSEAIVESHRRSRERKPSRQMATLHRQVCEHDVHRWSERFTSRLRGESLKATAQIEPTGKPDRVLESGNASGREL
ncbi:MAG: alpha,alpha-trehalose-phosphate synthase (UDP-forming) [Phycisphaerales bacterium]